MIGYGFHFSRAGAAEMLILGYKIWLTFFGTGRYHFSTWTIGDKNALKYPKKCSQNFIAHSSSHFRAQLALSLERLQRNSCNLLIPAKKRTQPSGTESFVTLA